MGLQVLPIVAVVAFAFAFTVYSIAIHHYICIWIPNQDDLPCMLEMSSGDRRLSAPTVRSRTTALSPLVDAS